MTPRIKAPSFATRAVFERAVDDLARETVSLRKVEAQRDARLQKIRDEYSAQISSHTDEIETLILQCEKFAHDHRDELLPGKLKSATTAQAAYGFRYGNPSLVLLNKKWSWAKVIAAIKSNWADAAVYLRTPDIEADKDKLKQLGEGPLAAVGLRVTQSETFYIEPKDQETAMEARVA